MLSARRQFLDAFLGALGASEIIDYVERADHVAGAVRYGDDFEMLDLSGHFDEEFQEFVWRVSEEEAPPLLVYQIADVLHRYHLVAIDRIRVSRDTLFAVLTQDLSEPVSRAEFERALAALEAITVPMREDGVETGDVFSIRA